jgi:hypothetical protein
MFTMSKSRIHSTAGDSLAFLSSQIASERRRSLIVSRSPARKRRKLTAGDSLAFLSEKKPGHKPKNPEDSNDEPDQALGSEQDNNACVKEQDFLKSDDMRLERYGESDGSWNTNDTNDYAGRLDGFESVDEEENLGRTIAHLQTVNNLSLLAQAKIFDIALTDESDRSDTSYYGDCDWGDVEPVAGEEEHPDTPNANKNTQHHENMTLRKEWTHHTVLKYKAELAFEKHFKDLLAFKEKFQHCNVPRRHLHEGNMSLGAWCSNMRTAYNQPYRKISKDRIERLQDIGFKWQVGDYYKAPFEKRYEELIAFNEKFGHCNVSQKYQGIRSPLGTWCSNTRAKYKLIKKGKTNLNLTPARIERLEEIGFHWQVINKAFEMHLEELISFKEKFGHCNVPSKYEGNVALGRWCNDMRTAYMQIQKKGKTNYNLSQDRIGKLDEIGFRWTARRQQQ